MTIQDMRDRKRELGYSNAYLSQLSGVPLGTIQKIFSGATASPRRGTLLALERVLAGGSRSASSVTASSAGKTPRPYPPADSLVRHSFVRDSHSSAAFAAEVDFGIDTNQAEVVFDRQGSYTLEDYYALPDDLRVEMIDGVFFVMDAPTTIHQLISGYIHSQFFNYAVENHGPCIPFISPLDVQLDRDDRTMLQPDVVVVCHPDIIIRRCIYGAPDLVIEVLSPSTRRKDMIIKLNKYMAAGVREIWFIDPDWETVLVYDFMQDIFLHHYTFEDTVPVRIWDGKCSIDFRKIRNMVGFIYSNEEKRAKSHIT